MSLHGFIEALQRAGLDADRDNVLDALWLASLGRDLGLSGTAVDAAAVKPSTPTQEMDSALGFASTPTEQLEPPVPNPDPDAFRSHLEPESDEQRSLYAKGEVSSEDRTVPASPVLLGAAKTLPNRLPLARALRPFRRRWPSSRGLELDEDATAVFSAELQAAIGHGVFPVMRSRKEPWYEAHLVLEDDPAIELWASPLREFAQMLRETGAFRLVRIWRLRLDPNNPRDLSRARLETPAGARMSCWVLGGEQRRLLFFASHGASIHWVDGIYRALLDGWSGISAVLLHLQPRRRWAHSLLGETRALAHAPQPGSPIASLEMEPLWWRPGPDPAAPGVGRLPVTSLTPAGLDAWARMQMGLGRGAEAFLFDPADEFTANDLAERDVAGVDLKVALTNLRERSMAAFDLAMMLSSAPFTLPVARLVQEATQQGSTDFTVLADLMLSGMVVSVRGQDEVVRETTYYEIHPEVRADLQRAMRDVDALALAKALEDRISAHLTDIEGRDINFAALLAEPGGVAKLPSWAHAFARMGVALLRRPGRPTGKTWRQVLDDLDPVLFGRLARLAQSNSAFGLQTVRPDLAPFAGDPRITRPVGRSTRHFRAEVAEHLEARLAQAPCLGLRILWVDDKPLNNRSLAEELIRRGADPPVEALSTEEALSHPELRDVDVIISDMSRDGNDQAGYDLLLSLRAERIAVPVIIFAGYSMRHQGARARVIAAGALGGTNSPAEVLDLVKRAAHEAVFVRVAGLDSADLNRERARLVRLLRARAGAQATAERPSPRPRPRTQPLSSASGDCAFLAAWDRPHSETQTQYEQGAVAFASWLASSEGRRIPSRQIALHIGESFSTSAAPDDFVQEVMGMPRSRRGPRTLFLYFAGEVARTVTGDLQLVIGSPELSFRKDREVPRPLAVSAIVQWATISSGFDRVVSLVEGETVSSRLAGLNAASIWRSAVEVVRPRLRFPTLALQIEYLRPGRATSKVEPSSLWNAFAALLGQAQQAGGGAVPGASILPRLWEKRLDPSSLRVQADNGFDLPLLSEPPPVR